MSALGSWFDGNNMVTELKAADGTGVVDATGALLTGATVTLTMYQEDKVTPVVRASGTWPVTMVEVGATAVYRYTEDTDDITVVVGDIVRKVANLVTGADQKARWVDVDRVVERFT
jgi:hypothetical protein